MAGSAWDKRWWLPTGSAPARELLGLCLVLEQVASKYTFVGNPVVVSAQPQPWYAEVLCPV